MQIKSIVLSISMRTVKFLIDGGHCPLNKKKRDSQLVKFIFMEEKNSNSIINLHNLLDYNASNFISAEIQLK